MKKVLFFLVSGLICLFININVINAQSQNPFQQSSEADNLVVMEAENFHENIPGAELETQYGNKVTHTWIKIDTTAGFSGTGSMISWPDSAFTLKDVDMAEDSAACLKYRVNFVTTGPHYIWIRHHGSGKGGSSKSYHIGFGDTITFARMDITANPPVFVWESKTANPVINPVIVDIPTVGVHTFSIYMRQDGAQIDKIIFTTNPDYQWSLPEGSLGPDESPRSEGENQAPVVDSPLGDLTHDGGFGSETIDLTGVFSDPDGDELTLSVTSSDETVVAASIDGASLIITEVGPGSSTVTVTATDNGTPEQSVSEPFTVTVNDITGISTINDNNKYSMSIYPNPSNGITHLNFESNKVEDVDIAIFNFVGQKLISKSYKSIPLTNGIDLPTQSLGKGIYLIQCKIAGQTQTTKLIKE